MDVRDVASEKRTELNPIFEKLGEQQPIAPAQISLDS